MVKPPTSFPGLSLSKGKTLATRLVSHAGHAQAMDNFQVLFGPKKVVRLVRLRILVEEEKGPQSLRPHCSVRHSSTQLDNFILVGWG